jgi:hypothetical protein
MSASAADGVRRGRDPLGPGASSERLVTRVPAHLSKGFILAAWPTVRNDAVACAGDEKCFVED